MVTKAEREAKWRGDVERFVLDALGPSGSSVLEVGCGNGELALALQEHGYSVVAIDPEAPEGRPFHRVKLEDFAADEPFDHVVASLSLHHIEDVSRALDKIASLLRGGGSIVVNEFGWDRLDARTARWVIERVPMEIPEEPSFMMRTVDEWRRAGGGEPASFVAHYQEEMQADCHPSSAIVKGLRARFEQRYFEWLPYLYGALDDTTRDDEVEAIEAGRVQPIGFRFVGSLRDGARS